MHGPPGGEENSTKKSVVPRVTDHVMKAPKINRNFIQWNALAQMRNAPSERGEERVVDAPNGNAQLIEKAGLAQKFTFKKDFGRAPAYLHRMKTEAAEEARRWEEEQEKERARREASKLSTEERDTILQVSNSCRQLRIGLFIKLHRKPVSDWRLATSGFFRPFQLRIAQLNT